MGSWALSAPCSEKVVFTRVMQIRFVEFGSRLGGDWFARHVNPVMDPRPNNIVTPHPSHKRVPLVCKGMQVAATKGVGVAKAKIDEIGGSEAP